MTWPKFKNPPIKEAVFNLRFSPSEIISFPILEKYVNLIKHRYTTVNIAFKFQIHSKVTQNKKPEVNSKESREGFRFIDQKRGFVFLITPNGFTLSKLSPYNNWEEIRDEADFLFKKLLTIVSNVTIIRLGLRYINEFKLRFGDEDLINNNLYFLPLLPQGIPTNVEGFNIQVIIPEKKRNLKSIINQTMKQIPGQVGFYNIILDIDVFKETNIGCNEVVNIFSEFDNLRNFKNEIFFNSLSDSTKSLFNA